MMLIRTALSACGLQRSRWYLACSRRRNKSMSVNKPKSAKEADNSNESMTSTSQGIKTQKSPQKPKRVARRFGDMSEEDVLKLKLPEHLDYNLDILFVGINPGLMAAYKGHHYAGANNHFWPCLYESGLIPERFTYLDDVRCPSVGIGLTNMVERTTRGSADLSRKEMRDGSGELIRKVKQYKPLIVCFNGKVIYELFSGSKCTVGRQKDPIPGTNTAVYVMPSTSGRTQTYPRASDKVPFFLELKALKEELKAGSNGSSSVEGQ